MHIRIFDNCQTRFFEIVTQKFIDLLWNNSFKPKRKLNPELIFFIT